MREVDVHAVDLGQLAPLLAPDRVERLRRYIELAPVLLEGRTVWNVNATATGGGVAEMLEALLAYARGTGVDTRWLVLDGTPEFFRLTKRVHNLLHGSVGDGGPVGEDERRLYEDVLATNLDHILPRVKAGDIVLLHDPQTAGMVEGLRNVGVHVVWRCHVGTDESNTQTELGWGFLKHYVEKADAVVFSRHLFVPKWVPWDRLWLIPPSLDPFSSKNCELSRADIEAILGHTGLVELPNDVGSLRFVRRDGSVGYVRRHVDLITAGGPVPTGGRIVLQVSRWDRLKDMAGVLEGFVRRLPSLPEDVHLVLAGPDVSGVSDDPEGAEVLRECVSAWLTKPPSVKRRVHLFSLPMDDIGENAHIVNALQRYASVVVQKSLVEGFGLTVTEPMWKARPVIASRVGGIQDQIVDGESGLLLDDPTDLDGLGDLLEKVLADESLARRLGTAARERVRSEFLGDRHLIQYVNLFQSLLGQ